MFVAVAHRQRQPGALLSCTQRGAPSRQQQGGQSVFILSQADRVSPAPRTLASHSQEGPELMLHPPLLGEVGVHTLEFGFQQVMEIRRRIPPPAPKFIVENNFIYGFGSACTFLPEMYDIPGIGGCWFYNRGMGKETSVTEHLLSTRLNAGFYDPHFTG